MNEHMDRAAVEAAEDLDALIEKAQIEERELTAREFVLWVRKHLMRAGYKRLMRAAFEVFGV